jgi:hypothetical protein
MAGIQPSAGMAPAHIRTMKLTTKSQNHHLNMGR